MNKSNHRTTKPSRILIVGAGLSGCVSAWCIRRHVPSATIEVWDGARGCGGRLATQRVVIQGGDQVRMNMGASRLHYSRSSSVTNKTQEELIQALETAGIVTNHSVGTGRDVGILVPTGASNEICRWMLTTAKVTTKFQSRIKSITWSDKTQTFQVCSFASKKTQTSAPVKEFDDVIFAGSPAEVRTTHGDIQRWTKPMWRQIGRVEHTRKCCLGLAFGKDKIVVNTIQRLFGSNRLVSVGEGQGILEELVLQPNDRGQQTDDRVQAVLVATSTDQFGTTHCQQLRATHRPTPQDLEQQQLVAERLRRAVCEWIVERSKLTMDQLLDAVIGKKFNYWKYAQVPFRQTKTASMVSSGASTSSRLNANKGCFVAAECPFVVVGDYFPTTHAPQGICKTSTVCAFTAVVGSAEAAANEIASITTGAL